MSCMLLFATLVFIVISAVSGLATPRGTAPTGWPSNLEPYNVYHHRYMTFKCHERRGTPFFSECCHPLLATEFPSKALPSHCIHSNLASSSITAMGPTTTDHEEMDKSPSTTQTESSISSMLPASAHIISTSESLIAVTSEATARPSSAHTFDLARKKHAHGHGYPSRQSSSGQVYSDGYATYFYQNGNAGACGDIHSDYDLIAAIDADRYGNLGEKSDLCGRKVRITNPSNKKSVVVTIADACPTCRNSDSIDLSLGAFKQIADVTLGIVSIQWQYA